MTIKIWHDKEKNVFQIIRLQNKPDCTIRSIAAFIAGCEESEVEFETFNSEQND